MVPATKNGQSGIFSRFGGWHLLPYTMSAASGYFGGTVINAGDAGTNGLGGGASTDFGKARTTVAPAAPAPAAGAGAGGGGQENAGAAPPSTAMTREEALKVLGLDDGAGPDDIKAAHRRLMAALHPDHGGSGYLAAKINQARDVLLGH